MTAKTETNNNSNNSFDTQQQQQQLWNYGRTIFQMTTAKKLNNSSNWIVHMMVRYWRWQQQPRWKQTTTATTALTLQQINFSDDDSKEVQQLQQQDHSHDSKWLKTTAKTETNNNSKNIIGNMFATTNNNCLVHNGEQLKITALTEQKNLTTTITIAQEKWSCGGPRSCLSYGLLLLVLPVIWSVHHPSSITPWWHHPGSGPWPGLESWFFSQFPGKTAISLHILGEFLVEPPGQGPFLVQWLTSSACQWWEFHSCTSLEQAILMAIPTYMSLECHMVEGL